MKPSAIRLRLVVDFAAFFFVDLRFLDELGCVARQTIQARSLAVYSLEYSLPLVKAVLVEMLTEQEGGLVGSLRMLKACVKCAESLPRTRSEEPQGDGTANSPGVSCRAALAQKDEYSAAVGNRPWV